MKSNFLLKFLLCVIYFVFTNSCSDSQRIDNLIQDLQSSSVSKQERAKNALADFEASAVPPLMAALQQTENRSFHQKILASLEMIGEPAVEPLIESFATINGELRIDIAKTLGNICPSAFDPLMNAFNNQDKKVRTGAIMSLGYLGDKRAIDALIQLFNSPDKEIRLYAAMAVGSIGTPALAQLKEIIKQENVDARLTSVMALGWIEDNSAVDALIVAVSDTNKNIRLTAIDALGFKRDYHAVEPLIFNLKDKDSDISDMALKSLRKITEEEFDKNPNAWQQWLEENPEYFN